LKNLFRNYLKLNIIGAASGAEKEGGEK